MANYCESEDVQDQLVILQQDQTAFPNDLITKAIKAACSKMDAVLGTVFIMPATSWDEELTQLAARYAALALVERKYAVSNQRVPEMVVRWRTDIRNDLRNAKLAYGPDKIDLGLTPLTEPVDAEALAQGVMTDKRAQTDRSSVEDWWEPADDDTDDSDHILGDQSVNT